MTDEWIISWKRLHCIHFYWRGVIFRDG